MTLARVATVLLAGAVLGASMHAQVREKTPPQRRAVIDSVKPAAEMENRTWMVGEWAVTETHEKSDSSAGGIGHGTSVIALGPGGFSQIFTYNSTGPAGKYSGHGIIAWDPRARIFRSVWTDNMTPGIVTTDCRADDKDLVCSGESVMEGRNVAVRSRSIAPNPSGWTEVIEMSMDGGPFRKVRTFAFRKAK
jgi:hypothetical protein